MRETQVLTHTQRCARAPPHTLTHTHAHARARAHTHTHKRTPAAAAAAAAAAVATNDGGNQLECLPRDFHSTPPVQGLES